MTPFTSADLAFPVKVLASAPPNTPAPCSPSASRPRGGCER
jgi:hypothetical protein